MWREFPESWLDEWSCGRAADWLRGHGAGIHTLRAMHSGSRRARKPSADQATPPPKPSQRRLPSLR
jgi:hypothetical protein